MSYRVTIDWNKDRTEVILAGNYTTSEGYIIISTADHTKIYVNPARALRVQIEEIA